MSRYNHEKSKELAIAALDSLSDVEKSAMTARYNLDGKHPGPNGYGEVLFVVAELTGLNRHEVRRITEKYAMFD